MKADRFNYLLQTAEFEDACTGEYRMFNEEDEEFFFNFSIPEGRITYAGDAKITDRQLYRVHNAIDEFIDDHLMNVHNDNRYVADDYEQGLYHYGY